MGVEAQEASTETKTGGVTYDDLLKVMQEKPKGAARAGEQPNEPEPAKEFTKKNKVSLDDAPADSLWEAAKGGGTNDDFEESEPKAHKTYEEPSAKSKSGGRLLARITDLGASFGLHAYSENTNPEDRDKFKATSTELDEISEAFAEYLEQVNQEIPPWLALVVAILVIYGAKAPVAHRDRKRNNGKNSKKTATSRKNTGNNTETVTDVEAEEITDEELNGEFLNAELAEINKLAAAEGLPIFENHTPIDGHCKWHWLIEGVRKPIGSGKFLDQSYSSKWGNLVKSYRARGVNLPQNVL